jgi:UrcA family protein
MRVSTRTALQLLPFAAAIMADSCIDPLAAAHAAPDGAPPSVTVSVKDLDLRSQIGAVSAYVRIRNAARSVCGFVDVVFPEERAAWDRCVDEAIGTVVARLGEAKLTECYLAKTHRSQLRTTGEISSDGQTIR